VIVLAMIITFISSKQTVSRCVKTTQEVKKSFENIQQFNTPALQSAENQQKLTEILHPHNLF
jgi:hypothetical protein